MSLKIGFIGTGSMGKPMVQKLLKCGYSVQVYDKTREEAEFSVKGGAVWAGSPRECAEGRDVVITCLPLPVHVFENMAQGPDAALQGMRPGSVWIDTSTTDYHNTLRIAALGKEKGVLSLEAPASNLSHMGIDFCNASFYVGGDKEGYEMTKDMLNQIGEISFFVGKIGEAQTIKLLTNLLYYTGTAIFGEAMVITTKNDIPLRWMWDYLINSTAYSIAVEQFGAFLFDGSYDTSCSLEIAHKDMSLTVDLGEELHVDLPLGKIIQKRYSQAYDKYHPFWHVCVNKLLAVENEVELQIPDFIACSKYGADKSYVRPDGLITDKFGRKKPTIYENYKCPEKLKEAGESHPEWKNLGDVLVDYITWTNRIVLNEALELGEKMGHSRALVQDCIRWSVGTCWLSDNEATYQENKTETLGKMSQLGFHNNLHLPILKHLLEINDSQ